MTGEPAWAKDEHVLKAHKLPLGETVGRWRILERLGRGAVASVYRAHDDARGHDVALKVLHVTPHEDEAHSAERLEREIELAQRIDDPAVCQIFELDTFEDLLLLVMEYIPGRSLRALLEEEGRIPPARATRIVHRVAEGLAAAHDEDILHRDLKPGNVMVRPDDTASILDFGYAIAPDVTRVTKKGSWVGTLAYAAPELLKDQRATRASDIYSVGVLLYECLTGEMPFIGHNYGELASAILFREVVPPSRLTPGLPSGLDDIVLQAMSREPDDRYHRADQLALAIAAILPDLEEEERTLTGVLPPVSEGELPPTESVETTAVNIEAPVVEITAVDIPAPEPFANQKTEVDSSPLFEATEPRARAPASIEVTAPPIRPPRLESAEPLSKPNEPEEPTDPRLESDSSRRDTVPMIPTPQAAHDRLAVHKRLADLSAALMRERQAKGIILGDDPDLDALERTAQDELRQGHWNDTIDNLERALERARAAEVDREFVAAKAERFEATMAEKAQTHNRDHFAGLLGRARAALEHGELASANQTLNRAFDTLRAK